MITKREMFSKMLSLLVLVLMSTSIDCQSNQSICDYIIIDGRVRDLGLYQFLYEFQNESGVYIGKSYRLFSRDISSEEYPLEMINWTLTAQPVQEYEDSGLHKFYGGYQQIVANKRVDPIDQKSINTHINCFVEQGVCLL